MGQERSSRQSRFALVEGCDECVAPGDRVGTLDLRAAKDAAKRCLERGCVWKEQAIKIKHSQETSEGTDGLGKGIGLNIIYTFREGVGTNG